VFTCCGLVLGCLVFLWRQGTCVKRAVDLHGLGDLGRLKRDVRPVLGVSGVNSSDGRRVCVRDERESVLRGKEHLEQAVYV